MKTRNKQTKYSAQILRGLGYTYRQIGVILKISCSTAWKYCLRQVDNQ